MNHSQHVNYAMAVRMSLSVAVATVIGLSALPAFAQEVNITPLPDTNASDSYAPGVLVSPTQTSDVASKPTPIQVSPLVVLGQVYTPNGVSSLNTQNLQTLQNLPPETLQTIQSLQENLPLPATKLLQGNPTAEDAAIPDPANTIVQYATHAAKREIVLSVRPVPETNYASVFINNTEVVKFRSEVAGHSAIDRAKLVAERLYHYIEGGGDLSRIEPSRYEDYWVIFVGTDILLTVDPLTAAAASLSGDKLAESWAKRLRDTLNPKQQPTATDINVLKKSMKESLLPTGKTQTGLASWYGGNFHGRRSANGQRFNMQELTAAHRTLPFGTRVRVKNKNNGKSCIVRITDRGPYSHGRIIDVSKAAARSLGMVSSGVAKVSVEVLKTGKRV